MSSSFTESGGVPHFSMASDGQASTGQPTYNPAGSPRITDTTVRPDPPGEDRVVKVIEAATGRERVR